MWGIDGSGRPVDDPIELSRTHHLTRRLLQFRHPVLTLLWCLRGMPLIMVSMRGLRGDAAGVGFWARR